MIITVRLEGGLGNQLFQFSYAYALQRRHGGRIILDRRLIEEDDNKNTALERFVDIPPCRYSDKLIANMLRIYAGVAIRLTTLFSNDNSSCAELLSTFGVHYPNSNAYLELKCGRLCFVYVHGYFMSEKFFKNSSHDVRSIINTARVLTPYSAGLVAEIKNRNSVAIHVRRGDYLSPRWRDSLNVCSQKYYHQAVQFIMENIEHPTFVVFSNTQEDTDWVRTHFRFLPADTVFVPPLTDDYESFALMSLCKHFVIANSTYSWWASYLGNFPDKMIVAPRPWSRDIGSRSDIYGVNWNIIDVD